MATQSPSLVQVYRYKSEVISVVVLVVCPTGLTVDTCLRLVFIVNDWWERVTAYVLGTRRGYEKVQLPGEKISNRGQFPPSLSSKILLISWQIICTLRFKKWILSKFFFFRC